MYKLCPVSKGSFSACLCKVYLMKVFVILVEIYIFIFVISCVMQVEKISFISFETFFTKGQER